MATATTAPTNTTTTSTLSDWAGPYVTSMLGKTQALANEGYQQYGGPLTAGPSQLQNQAFQGIAGLTVPNQPFNSTNFNSGYTAGQTANTFTPGTFTSGTNYNPTQFTSSFNPNTFSTNLPGTSSSNPYGVAGLTDYMNPYLEQVLSPQIREMQRQAQIDQMNNADRFVQAGAYGGSRQAIMDAELQRNLLQGVGDVTGKAYGTAYDKALDQQFRTAQLGLDAQKASEQSRQFGASHGLDTQKATEQSKQFGSSQMLDSQKLAEQSKQFGANLGLETFKANEDAKRQQGVMNLESQRLTDQSKQFGANYGLQQHQQGLAGLAAMLQAGDIQRQIEQQGLTADYNEFAQQREHPYDQLKFMREMITGMPISTVQNTPNPQSNSQQMAGLIADIMAMFKNS